MRANAVCGCRNILMIGMICKYIEHSREIFYARPRRPHQNQASINWLIMANYRAGDIFNEMIFKPWPIFDHASAPHRRASIIILCEWLLKAVNSMKCMIWRRNCAHLYGYIRGEIFSAEWHFNRHEAWCYLFCMEALLFMYGNAIKIVKKGQMKSSALKLLTRYYYF